MEKFAKTCNLFEKMLIYIVKGTMHHLKTLLCRTFEAVALSDLEKKNVYRRLFK